jgi:hypothetical protein
MIIVIINYCFSIRFVCLSLVLRRICTYIDSNLLSNTDVKVEVVTPFISISRDMAATSAPTQSGSPSQSGNGAVSFASTSGLSSPSSLSLTSGAGSPMHSSSNMISSSSSSGAPALTAPSRTSLTTAPRPVFIPRDELVVLPAVPADPRYLSTQT